MLSNSQDDYYTRQIALRTPFDVSNDEASITSARSSWRPARLCSVLSSTGVLLAAILASGMLLAGAGIAIEQNYSQPLSSPARSSNSGSPTSSSTCSDSFASLESTASIQGLSHAAIASDQGVCSQMGVQILQQGGHAVDAAVTVALCLGVANPKSSGIGGGGMIVVYADPVDSSRTMPDFIDARNGTGPVGVTGKLVEVIDCREVAPQAAYTEMFTSDNGDDTATSSTVGGLAVAVPGELRGLELAHARHGRLSWKSVVQPVYEWVISQEGVTVSSYLAHEIAQFAQSSRSQEGAVDYGLLSFLTTDNDWSNPLQEGDRLPWDTLSNTLHLIMEEGADALYTGSMAESIAQDVQNAGGVLTADDLTNYKPTIRSPVAATDVQGFTLLGAPPPSSGGAVVLGAMRFLAGLSWPLVRFSDTLTQHWLVEACKHVFAMRMSLSDPSYNTQVVQNVVDDLTQGSYMDILRQATLDDGILDVSAYGGSKWNLLDKSNRRTRRHLTGSHGSQRRLARPFGYLDDAGTSHFSIVDADGNAVAMTTTINTSFGSQIVSSSTGIILNNHMDDFATPSQANHYGLRPSEANYIQPGKKPLSSMSPTLVFRQTSNDSLGPLVLVIGASGGPRIITATLQALVNYLFLGKSLFDAIVAPRMHEQLLYFDKPVINAESTWLDSNNHIAVSDRTLSALSKRNQLYQSTDFVGVVQAVAIDMETGELSAVSDVRKQGSPAGY
jgi:gamma-glutamyltranspeptidase